MTICTASKDCRNCEGKIVLGRVGWRPRVQWVHCATFRKKCAGGVAEAAPVN